MSVDDISGHKDTASTRGGDEIVPMLITGPITERRGEFGDSLCSCQVHYVSGPAYSQDGSYTSYATTTGSDTTSTAPIYDRRRHKNMSSPVQDCCSLSRVAHSGVATRESDYHYDTGKNAKNVRFSGVNKKPLHTRPIYVHSPRTPEVMETNPDVVTQTGTLNVQKPV